MYHILLSVVLCAMIQANDLVLPQVPEPACDGAASWNAAALVISHLPIENLPQLPATAVSDAQVYLGWCNRGVAVAIEATATSWDIDALRPWEATSLEVFLGQGKPAQVVLLPGAPAERLHPQAQVTQGVAAEIPLAATRLADGWRLEALIPWSVASLPGTAGSDCTIRLAINHRQPGGERWQRRWDARRVRLGSGPVLPQDAGAAISFGDDGRWHVLGCAAVDRMLMVVQEGRTIASATLARDPLSPRRRLAQLALPVTAITAMADVELLLDGVQVRRIRPESPIKRIQAVLVAAARTPSHQEREDPAAAALAQMVVPQPALVFAGDAFPVIPAGDPALRAGLGIVGIDRQWYDGAGTAVSVPGPVGRHALVTTVRYASDAPLVIRRTACRLPDGAAVSTALGVVLPGRSQEILTETVGREFVAQDVAARIEAQADGAPLQSWGRTVRWWHRFDQAQGTASTYTGLVALPPDYDSQPDRRWPCVLFLHGFTQAPIEGRTLQPELARRAGAGWIAIAPQCRPPWSPAAIIAYLDEQCRLLRIDPQRVVIMGFSMGGGGTWATAAAYPERFRALVVLAGSDTRPEDADVLAGLPIRIFVGGLDSANTMRRTAIMEQAVRQAGCRDLVRTVLPDANHLDIPPQALARADLWAWLGEQVR